MIPCKIWHGNRTTKGNYGLISINGKRKRVHRVEWEKHNGPIPEGLDVLHHCDRPYCYEIEHLFLGTDDDNSKDMVSKNRQAYGERNGRSKLTEDDVFSIGEQHYLQGISIKSLAKKYNVHVTTIQRALNRETWKHV